jgi:hypothetical protein
MTSVAWAPALLLGGVSLLWARRQQGVEQGAAHGAAQGALPAAA